MITLAIGHHWDGRELPSAQRAVVQLTRQARGVRMRSFAPWHGDPPPPGPPGPTDRLWEHEVVECFIAGPTDHYLEVELGPHGHHLVLRLEGLRCPVQSGLPLPLVTRRCGDDWWSAEAVLPNAWLPEGPLRTNAYRLHGLGSERAHLCHAPTMGSVPDFHTLDRFVSAEGLDAPESAAAAVSEAARALGASAGPERGIAHDLTTWTAALVGALRAEKP